MSAIKDGEIKQIKVNVEKLTKVQIEDIVAKLKPYGVIIQLITDVEEYEDEELRELSEQYGHRVDIPKKEWIEVKEPSHFKDLILQHKKAHGWKFKDEE